MNRIGSLFYVRPTQSQWMMQLAQFDDRISKIDRKLKRLWKIWQRINSSRGARDQARLKRGFHRKVQGKLNMLESIEKEILTFNTYNQPERRRNVAARIARIESIRQRIIPCPRDPFTGNLQEVIPSLHMRQDVPLSTDENF